MTRNKEVDIIKAIGIITIILSHCSGKPFFIDYFRNYEVVLLVIASSMLYKKNTLFINKKEYLSYVKKRVIRIAIPTWGFLTVLFLMIGLSSFAIGRSFPYDFRTIVESYLMINGVGYVWIMLVYIMIAIALPIFSYYYEKNKLEGKKWKPVVLFSIMFIVYLIIRYAILQIGDENLVVYIVKNTILYAFVYGIVSWFGSNTTKLENKKILTIAICMLFVHCFWQSSKLFFTGMIPSLAVEKYPPSLLYLLYALPVSLLIILIVRKYCSVKPNGNSKLIIFISKNSQWIYFNHILVLYVWNMFFSGKSWVLCFVTLFIGSLILTSSQMFIVHKLLPRNWKVTKIIERIFG